MRKLSFQWRITLMTALLLALTCVVLNLLLYRSGIYYFDTLDDYVVECTGGRIPEGEASEDVVIIDMTPEEFESFSVRFTEELIAAKEKFGEKSWLITAVITLLGGVVAYFVCGRSLKPLREFSSQAEQVQAKNLTATRLNEDTVPEFRTLSQSINQMLERLSAAFAAQKQFVGNAAHELRTPLALMQARLDLYKKETHQDMREADETITMLSEQTERLSHLVKTLLDMSELETIPRTDCIELGPMIEEVLTDLSPLAEKNAVTLEQAGEALTVSGSDVLLYRLLFNLVENGVKYNRPGGRVTVSVQNENRTIVIRVCDTGPGIPEDCRESIFQPFYRVDKSRSRSMGGVGLGLALVWEIARLHGGTVVIEKSGETGTVVAVRLPLP